MFFAAVAKARNLGLTCALGAVFANSAWGFQSAPTLFDASANSVALVDLPRHARTTHALILAGGPFPYDKDGTVFGNRERLLPRSKRGYYREYTVKTPGIRHRGAKRIICGGIQSVPDSCYYTADHYASFQKIVN